MPSNEKIRLYGEPNESAAAAHGSLEQVTCPLCQSRLAVETLLINEPLDCDQCGLNFVLSPPKAQPEVAVAVPGADKPTDVLGRWLAGEPIQSRPLPRTRLAWRWCRENALATAAAGGVLAAILLVTAGSNIAYLRTAWRLQDALDRAETAQSASLQAEQSLSLKQRIVEKQTQLYLSERKTREKLEQRLNATQLSLQRAELKTKESETLRVQAEREVRAAFSKQLASQSELVSAQSPRRSLLLAAEAITVTHHKGEAPVTTAVQRLRDALGGADGQRLMGHTGKVGALAVSADSRWLATGSLDGTARLWDLQSNEPSSTSVVLEGHRGRISSVTFTPDLRHLITGSFDSTVCLWSLAAEDGAGPTVLRGHEGRITSVTVSADSRWLLTGSGGFNLAENTARLWDLSSREPAMRPVVLHGHTGQIHALAISPDQRWVATAGEDSTVRLWDLTTKYPASSPLVMRTPDGRAGAVAFSVDSRWLITGHSGQAAGEHAARLWDLTAKDPTQAVTPLVGHTAGVRAVAVSANGRWLATASEDRTVRVWDLLAKTPGARSIVLRGHTEEVNVADFSPDGNWLVTGSADHSVRLWSTAGLAADSQPVVLHPHQGPISAVAMTPDSHWLITTGDDTTARRWNLRLDELVDLAMLKAGHEEGVEDVAQAPIRFSLPDSDLKTR